MLPSFVVVALGFDPTQSLVFSQVILSLVLPVPMIALVIIAGRKDVMGAFASGPLLRAATVAATGLILMLNALLVTEALGLNVLGFS